MGPSFGRYESMFRIAGGGMAEVFAGRVRGEAGFEKLVAIKRVLPHLAGEESIAKMFLDEARVAANITSPHVVQTIDLGRTEEGLPYLVMELVVGIDLAEVLRLTVKSNGRIPVGVGVEILAQAGIGLHAAHEARTPAGEPMHLVHRDVSPQNLLIAVDGRVRVTDFGIAWVALDRLTQTSTGTYKGKYSYFSPEQSRRARLDRRSDIFALGIVAWETLAQRKLFAREDVIETIEAIRDAVIPPLTEIHADVPDAVDAVVRRALARDPADRYATAREFADALRAAARASGIEPSDAAVATFVAELGSPRLTMLADKLREISAGGPSPETQPDVEATDQEHLAPTGLPVEVDLGAASVPVAPARSPSRRALVFGAVGGAVLLLAALAYAAASLTQGDPPATAAALPPAPSAPSPSVSAPSAAAAAPVEPAPSAVEEASPAVEPSATDGPTAAALPAAGSAPARVRPPRRRAEPRTTSATTGSSPSGLRPLSVDAFDRGARRGR